MNPKVSVIVPVYNVMPYLNCCLHSLASQSFHGMEVLLINDGSPDRSQEIIDRYVQAFPELFRAFVKPNGGLSDARNYGIERAQGDFIAFVDSDDYIAEDMIEKLYTRAIQEQADLVVCDFIKLKRDSKERCTDLSNKKTCKYRAVTNLIDETASLRERPEYLRGISALAWNKLFKRELFTETGLRFPCQWYEDSAVIYNIALHAKRIAAVHEGLYFYCTSRAESITNTFDRRTYDIFRSCDSILAYYEQQGVLESFHNEIEYLCIMELRARLKTLRRRRNLKLQLRFARDCIAYLDGHFANWRDNSYYCQVRSKKIEKNGFWALERAYDTSLSLRIYLIRNDIRKYTRRSYWKKKVKSLWKPERKPAPESELQSALQKTEQTIAQLLSEHRAACPGTQETVNNG